MVGSLGFVDGIHAAMALILNPVRAIPPVAIEQSSLLN
jgi:hypothetical protein